MKFIGIYLLFGICASYACWLFLKRRDQMMAKDLWLIYSFDLGGILLFLVWPLYLPAMCLLSVHFPSSPPDSGPTPDSIGGLSGIAKSSLRPAGKIEVEGELYEALSVGGQIEQGSEVLIVDRDSLAVKVTKA